MGIFAGLAHVPFIGPLTTAAAHAPDTLTAAVGATTSGATAGLSMAAIGGALVLGPTTPTTAFAAATPATVNVIGAEQATPDITAEAPPMPTTQATTNAPVWRPVTVVAEATHPSPTSTTASTTTTVPVTSPPATPPPAQPVQVAQIQPTRTTAVVPPSPSTTVAQAHEDATNGGNGNSYEGQSGKDKSGKGKSDSGHGDNKSSDQGSND